MTGTNCLGRLSPVIVRVIDCKRVPSPPARMIAHRSVRRECWVVVLRIDSFRGNVCWGDVALMIIGFLFTDWPNNHESELGIDSLQIIVSEARPSGRATSHRNFPRTNADRADKKLRASLFRS